MNKVLFVIGLSKNGGAEKRAKYISSLIKDEFDSSVFAFVGKKGEADFAFKESYEAYKSESKSARIEYLANVLKQEKPDVVFSFVPHINFFTTRAVKKAKNKDIKHVVCITNTRFGFVNKMLLGYSLKRCEAVYYQCEEQKQFFKCSKPSFVIPNPINVPSFFERKFFNRFMSAGRLEDQKDYSLQINAFLKIAKRNPNATLDIYGNGSQKEMLLALIQQLNLTNKVAIHEYTDKINEEYKKHDVFLFTTRAEGFPNALAEAMANGLVCFTTHFHTGCDELIVDGKTGFVCKSRDPKEYADMVCNKLGEIENAKQVAKDGYEHIKELCSSEKFKERMKEDINKLL